MNSSCKVGPIRKFYKEEMEKSEIVQYIGIAVDEPKRLERITGDKVSLLAKYGYTEKMAYDLCKEYGLLSPIYEYFPRGGCWFCPNARDKELIFLKQNHPELWYKLLNLPKDNIASMKFNRKETIHEINERLFQIEQE